MSSPARRRSRPRSIAAVAALVAGALLGAGQAGAATEPPQGPRSAAAAGVVDGSYIVVYRDRVLRPAAETAGLRRRLGFEVDHAYSAALSGYAARLSRSQLSAVRSDPNVAFVARNRRVKAAASVPLAPGEPRPPTGVRRVTAATSTTTREASTSNVAVLDTGIKLRHPDLNAGAGTDCIQPGTPPVDEHGHGSHVAGTIGALNNGAGVVGVAPGTKVVAVRVLDEEGFGTWAQIICGIDWVTANHRSRDIDVANMSLGGHAGRSAIEPCATSTDPLHLAICNSTAAGVTYVVAAGNDSSYIEDYPCCDYFVPAAFPEVLTVTAISDTDGRPGALGPTSSCTPYESDDAHAIFSNFGSVDAPSFLHTIAAPGTCINSTWGKGPEHYKVLSGTSMAAPHVAGLLALCLGELTGDRSAPGRCAGKTPAEVIEIMRARAARVATARPALGFWGDPNDDLWPRYYGYLARPVPAPPPPP